MSWPPTEHELVEYALDRADTSARVDRLLEASFLGAVLCADVIDRVWFLLAPSDFYDGVHAAIWTACLRLRARHHVTVLRVLGEFADLPVALDRVRELERCYLDGEGALPVLYAHAALIRRASAERQAARAKRRV